MAELKNQPSKDSVDYFLKNIEDEQKQKDCFELLKMFSNITKCKPVLWGKSIVGFGKYHYKYESGREGDWFITGFSPRKQNISIYILSGFKTYEELMNKLGKFKTGSSCLYIKKLDEIDGTILKKLIKESFENMNKKYYKKK